VRVALAAGRRRPLRWRRFREYVQDALLIKWAGSNQEFVHRLVRDYFATRELVAALADDERRGEALRRLGFQGESAIEILAEYLGHPDPETQEAAVEGLGRIQSPRVLDFLKQAVRSPDPAVRRGVVVASRLRNNDDWRTVSEGLMAEEDVSVILAWAESNLARDEGGTHIQFSVTGEVIVTSNENVWKQGVWRDELMFRFLTVTRCDRRLVVAALAHAARAGFGLDVTTKHHHRYGRRIRVDELEVLVGRGWDRFRPLGEILPPEGWVAEWLAHVHPAVRLGAVVVASATGRLAVAQAGELLRRDPEAAVRANAALALGEFHAGRSGSDPPAVGLEEVQSYLAVGTRDSDPRVRAASSYTAASLPDAGCRVILEVALRDPDPRVRSAAVWGLAVKWTFNSEALLRGALGDPDPAVRRSVVEALLGLATLRVPHLPEIPSPDEIPPADDPESLHWAERAIAGLRRD
jgi:HEAT repeat protein